MCVCDLKKKKKKKLHVGGLIYSKLYKYSLIQRTLEERKEFGWRNLMVGTKSNHQGVEWVQIVDGTEQKHSLLKTKVKHNRVWSPNGWVTITGLALHLPRDFFGVKFCADSTKVLQMRL